jgi:DNA-binding NarL/FixJ family response regulator
VTRVLIADDDLMRAGLIELLTADPEIEIVGQASTGREAVDQARRLAPDVVLMDVRMPDLDGITATREVSRAAPDTSVLILTTFEQDDYVFGALRAGASGFLLKRARPEELIAAVHTIAAAAAAAAAAVVRHVRCAHSGRRVAGGILIGDPVLYDALSHRLILGSLFRGSPPTWRRSPRRGHGCWRWVAVPAAYPSS